MDTKKIVRVMAKAVILSALLTAAALGLLSLLAFLAHFDDGKIHIGVVAVNVAACLLGGLAAGKGMKEKKYLWGLLLGAVYFVLIFACSLIFAQGDGVSLTGYITTILICLGSGMLGGMLG